MPYHTCYTVICRVVIAGNHSANELRGSGKVVSWEFGYRSEVLAFALPLRTLREKKLTRLFRFFSLIQFLFDPCGN